MPDSFAPWSSKTEPDHTLFVAHAKRLIAQGCDGVALLGTTGEANSFSLAQRKVLLDVTVEAGIAPEKLMPGTGVAAMIDLTKHALSLGVNTVVMLPPFYYKGVTDDGLFAAYSEVIERIGDARLRVVLYHSLGVVRRLGGHLFVAVHVLSLH